MSWSRLPQELRDQILGNVFDDTKIDKSTLPNYQLVGKEWNGFIKGRQLLALHLCEQNTDGFCAFLTAKPWAFRHIRRITYDVSSRMCCYPHEYSTLDHPAVLRPLWNLLNTLAEVTNSRKNSSIVADHPGIVLQIKLEERGEHEDGDNDDDNDSDDWAYLRRDLALERSLLGRLQHNRVVTVCQVDQYALQAVSSACVQQVLACCESLQVARISEGRRQYGFDERISHMRPDAVYDNCIRLLQLPLFQAPKPQSQPQSQAAAAATAATTLALYSMEDDSSYCDADSATLGWLAAKAAAVGRLQHVSIALLVDADQFWTKAPGVALDPDMPQIASWPGLKTLTLTSKVLDNGASTSTSTTTTTTTNDIRDLLVRASAAAARMPQLEVLEIFYAGPSSAAMFRATIRTTTSTIDSPAVLSLCSTWHDPDPESESESILNEPSLLKAWQDALGREVTVVESALDKSLGKVFEFATWPMYTGDLRTEPLSMYAHCDLQRELSVRGSWYRQTPQRLIFDEADKLKRLGFPTLFPNERADGDCAQVGEYQW